MKINRFWLWALWVGATVGAPLAAAPTTLTAPTGATVQVDAATGRYQVSLAKPAWTFAGELGGPATGVEIAAGADGIGAYREINLAWSASPAAGPAAPEFHASIRAYDTRPAVLFTITDARAEKIAPPPWPRFTSFPARLHHFSYQDAVFAPPTFTLAKNGTPWLLFDDLAEAVILSPADNFMTACMAGDGVAEIACGLNPEAADLPAQFTRRVLLAFGSGINATWDAWGGELTDLAGKARPANDADLGLRCLGYWTDNGATYYYHYDSALGYAGTLEKLAAYDRKQGVPIRYLQLDSWWYYKSLTDPNGAPLHRKVSSLPEGEWNRYGGLLKYEAHPAVLPDGLAGFAAKVQLPLITHNRWIDLASPYRQQYRISGYAAIDPRWWSDIMGYLHESGVVGYEQDWLNVIYLHSPELVGTPGRGEAFADAMSQAARAKGLTIQYCMPLPRFYLQASRYDNVTTARTSRDRFQRAFWDPFLYTSRLASAVGVWPWTDVFMSTETDNALIAILSAGMWGPGDPIGEEAAVNISRAARADGVLVKPDAALLPTDDMYLAEANGAKPPMVAWTYTDHPAQRTAYLYLYDRAPEPVEATFTPAAFGFAGEVMVLNRGTGAAWRQPADELFIAQLVPAGFAYFEIAPIGPGGIVFFGDQGKFVSNGRKRIASLQAGSNRLRATVSFAAGERSVTLFGFSRGQPAVRAESGRAGPVTYGAGNGRYSFEAFPAETVTTEPPGGEKIRQAVIEIIPPVSARRR